MREKVVKLVVKLGFLEIIPLVYHTLSPFRTPRPFGQQNCMRPIQNLPSSTPWLSTSFKVIYKS